MKKLICLAVVMPLVVAVCSGEMRYYSDWKTGYKGYVDIAYTVNLIDELGSSSAFYSYNIEGLLQNLQKVRDTEFKKQMGIDKVRDIEKLSKEENFLLWSALNEYELSDGDMYSVTCTSSLQPGPKPTSKYFSIVIINNGNSFKWVGAEFSLEELIRRELEGK